MKVEGVVKLVYKGIIIEIGHYQGIGGRQKIIRGWIKVHGDKFFECAIDILPRLKKPH